MTEDFLLINYSYLIVKRLRKHTHKKGNFFEYFFIDSRKIIGVLRDKPPLMITRERLKIDSARDEWKKS